MPSYFLDNFSSTCRQKLLICSHYLYYTTVNKKSILEINEHTFYNYFRVKFKGGIAVDEKEEIVKMLDQLKNPEWIHFIYVLIKGLLK